MYLYIYCTALAAVSELFIVGYNVNVMHFAFQVHVVDKSVERRRCRRQMTMRRSGRCLGFALRQWC